MPVLVSDEVLDSLICSFCEKYLSVGPIKIYNNRKVKCGRCPEIPNDPGIDSIYWIVAEKILFKCINVYEGCRNILSYNDAKKHEETCLSTKFLCPICMENIWIYLLKNHVMRKHKQVLLNSNYISLNLQDIPSVTSKIYFYHNLNNLFVVNISFDKFAENHLQVNARLIGYNQQEAVGTQRYIFRYCSKFSIESPIKPLYSNNSHNFDISKIKMNNPKCQGVSYIEFDFQINSIFKTFNIPQEKVSSFDMCKSSLQLSEKDISAVRQSGDMLLGKISLECYFCNQLCLNSVLYYQSHYLYENSQHHFLCYYCSIYYKTFNNENFLRVTETILPYSVYSKLQYFCYWNCGYAFNASNLYSHQFICIKQSNMKCVKNTCNFISTYTDFENHYEEVHHFSKFERIKYFHTTEFSIYFMSEPLWPYCICYVKFRQYLVSIKFIWYQLHILIHIKCHYNNYTEDNYALMEGNLKLLLFNDDVFWASVEGKGGKVPISHKLNVKCLFLEDGRHLF